MILLGIWLAGAAGAAALLHWDDPVAFQGDSAQSRMEAIARGGLVCMMWPLVLALVMFGYVMAMVSDDDEKGGGQ